MKPFIQQVLTEHLLQSSSALVIGDATLRSRHRPCAKGTLALWERQTMASADLPEASKHGLTCFTATRPDTPQGELLKVPPMPGAGGSSRDIYWFLGEAPAMVDKPCP